MEKDIINETINLLAENDNNEAYDSWGDITIDVSSFSNSGKQDIIQSLEYVVDYLKQFGIYTRRYGEYFEVDDAEQLKSISKDVGNIISKLQDLWD